MQKGKPNLCPHDMPESIDNRFYLLSISTVREMLKTWEDRERNVIARILLATVCGHMPSESHRCLACDPQQMDCRDPAVA